MTQTTRAGFFQKQNRAARSGLKASHYGRERLPVGQGRHHRAKRRPDIITPLTRPCLRPVPFRAITNVHMKRPQPKHPRCRSGTDRRPRPASNTPGLIRSDLNEAGASRFDLYLAVSRRRALTAVKAAAVLTAVKSASARRGSSPSARPNRSIIDSCQKRRGPAPGRHDSEKINRLPSFGETPQKANCAIARDATTNGYRSNYGSFP
jgi:hypothetical protein